MVLEEYEYKKGKVPPIEVQIRNFLRARLPSYILENLKWLIIRTLADELTIGEFKRIIEKKGLTWKKVLDYCKEIKGYKRTAIRFYYLMEFRPRILWAVTVKEIVKDIINKGVGISIRDGDNAFDQLGGGHSWESILKGILGERYI